MPWWMAETTGRSSIFVYANVILLEWLSPCAYLAVDLQDRHVSTSNPLQNIGTNIYIYTKIKKLFGFKTIHISALAVVNTGNLAG